MPERIAGDAVSHCSTQHVVYIRLVTFTTSRHAEELGLSFASDWTPQIMIAFAGANRIFQRYNITIRIVERNDISIEESRRILSSSREDEVLLEGYNEEYRSRLRNRGLMHDREDGGYALTEEVSLVLSQHRGPRTEVHTYWVPEISPLGNTYIREFFRGITNEGILIKKNVPSDTLAHELGHILTRDGHVDYVGEGEGHPPSTNLMYGDSGTRQEPRELNDPQLSRIRASEFCQLYDRRRTSR